jgi:hypothetical protein
MSGLYRRVVTAGLATTLAGCGGLLPGPGESSSTPSTESDDSTNQTQQDQNSTESTTITETNYPTSDVLLSVPELGEGYSLTGETRQAQSSADDEQLDTLRETGIVRQHERSFRLETNDDDRASVVFSSVTVYESEETATEAVDEILNSIQENGGSVEDRSVLSGVSASMAKFENSEDAFNTLFIRRSGVVRYYVATSDQTEFFRDQTRDLFVRMVTATPD